MLGNRIIRVFPTKTNMVPCDDYVFFGVPGLFIPDHDEVHISTIFTWDKVRAVKLLDEWEFRTDKPVKIGGPAFDDAGDEFTPGKYLRSGCVITSRGCPNRCPFCYVPIRSGKVRELNVKEGNIILDDNLLACSRAHIRKVFEMLRTQSQIIFSQGLDASRMNDDIIEELHCINIKEIWVAYDLPYERQIIIKLAKKLMRFFSQSKLRCYVLVGWGKDTFEKAEERLRFVFELGYLPFAMLYRDDTNTLGQCKNWREFQGFWTRPSVYKSVINKPELMRLKQYQRFKHCFTI